MAKARSAGNDLIHVPLALGAVVPVYNLNEIKEPLRFTGAILADIYLGKIKKWNHPTVRELNPNASLPDLDIIVVNRSDGSGTTYIWTDFLCKTSVAWDKEVGIGTKVKWPEGESESGNEGVSQRVRATRGAIGYVELTYAFRFDLAIGLVQNREKEFVKASLLSVAKAAENGLAEIPDDLRYSLTDAPGKGSYPIAGTTWAIVRLQQLRVMELQIIDFLNWATDQGQNAVNDLLYGRLPPRLAERAKQEIAKIQLGD